MPLREIIQHPDPMLLSPSGLIDPRNPPADYEDIVNDLTLYVAGKSPYGNRCWGLSAVQIGAPYQIMAMQYGSIVLVLVNPTITKTSAKLVTSTEGCMSVCYGETSYNIKRHKAVKVTALRAIGTIALDPMTMKEHGRYALILQHEIDHMNGLTIVETHV